MRINSAVSQSYIIIPLRYWCFMSIDFKDSVENNNRYLIYLFKNNKMTIAYLSMFLATPAITIYSFPRRTIVHQTLPQYISSIVHIRSHGRAILTR